MMFLSTAYYAWLAWQLARRTGRDDVCALPSGVSVPHMFVVTFVIMLPIASATGDPVKGWEAGLVWVFFQSFILMIGGFIAPYIRKITPRAALLGTLAGVSIAFISMRPALEIFLNPVIGVVCFAIIMVSWFGGVRYPRGIPAGLVAIGFGLVVAWLGAAVGWDVGRRRHRQAHRLVRQFRLLAAGPGHRPGVRRLPVSGRDPGHRDPVRHLRPGRGHGQCRECRGGRRPLPDHPRAHRRRRGQPDRLPDGQPVHQRGLYRPSRLEGDGRPPRLHAGDRRHGHRAVLVRDRRRAARDLPGGRDLADPALYRHADRRAGLPDHAAPATRRRSSWPSPRIWPPGPRSRSTVRWPPPAPRPAPSASRISPMSAWSITASRSWAAAPS